MTSCRQTSLNITTESCATVSLEKLFKNNQRWAESKLASDPHYFAKLSQGQHPEILYIGCSDSRVTAEDMIGAEPGELFVHRNIANLVPNTDISSLAVIKFAVEYLKVSHIVVCGHFRCGGVAAAMQSDNLGILNPWLGNIRDVYRLHQSSLDALEDLSQRHDRLVELNVQEQCMNVLKLPEVQVAIVERKLAVHGWVFDIGTGRLHDLHLDLDALHSPVKTIYQVNEA